MARSLWKGSISFGLVNIPIELHTAVRDHRPKFRMLHATDKSPVKYERVCIKDGHAVGWEDLVKGFEYAKGHFVILTKDDFKAAAVEKTRTIDIIDFVKRTRSTTASSRRRTTSSRRRVASARTRCSAKRSASRTASASRSSSCATPSILRRSRSSTRQSCCPSCGSPTSSPTRSRWGSRQVKAFASRSSTWPKRW